MTRSTIAGEDTEVTPPRPTRRTVIFGYLLAVVAGFAVFQTTDMVWTGSVVSRFQVGFILILDAIAIIPLWIACIIPFAIARHIHGPQRLASPWVATGLGILTGLAAIPFTVEVRRMFDFEGVSPAYAADLALAISRHGPLHALAGAAAGLTCWFVEFPRLFKTLPGGEGLENRHGRALSRRNVTILATLVGIAALVPLARWWWSPHVTGNLATARVTYLREWSIPSWARCVGWLPDGRGVVSLYQGVIAINDVHGRSVSRHAFAGMGLSGTVAGGEDVAIPADYSRTTAFSIFDLTRGIVVHEEPDPAPGGGSAGAAVRLAMTPDGSRLAVAYFAPREGQRVRVYDTRNWRLASTMDTVPAGAGASSVAISQDGRLLAFGSGMEVVIADAVTGKTLHTLKVSPGRFAFSPQDDRIAVRSAFKEAIDIIRIADETTVASYKLPTHWYDGSHRTRSLEYGHVLVWDRLDRFVAFDDGGGNVILWNPAKAADESIALRVRLDDTSAAVSPDGTHFAVGNGAAVSLFQIGSGPT